MPLKPGTMLGHYEVRELIGVGGNQSRPALRDKGADHPSPDRKGGVASPTEPPLPGGRGSESSPDTIQDIIARVLQSEPDWNALPARTPAQVRVLLRRCLEKDV